MTTKFRVESGMQMLARLTKRPNIEKFYPSLFGKGPRTGNVIEFFSNDDMSNILCDIICESIIPLELDGPEAGVIIFSADGKLDFDILIKQLRKKLAERSQSLDLSRLDDYFQSSIKNVLFFNVYDATQLYTTIQTLESILINYPNISLIVFDTLTAFYWSEQNFKISKMDLYTKNLIHIIQNVIKDHKVTILYTRPDYFSTTKGTIAMLEPCTENPTLERLNYRVQILYNEDDIHHALVRTHDALYTSSFKMLDDDILWLESLK